MDLLTTVLARLVNKKAAEHNYGVAISNIPSFDYALFVNELSSKNAIQLFFIGFEDSEYEVLRNSLPSKEEVEYFYTIEDAEDSRNNGIEDVFRVLIIRRSDIEKISSLQWFPEITLPMIYTESCKVAKDSLNTDTNSVIMSLIKAFKRRQVQNILSFERIIEYLEILINTTDVDKLPSKLRENYYRLGLFSDKNIDRLNPSVDTIVERIKKNHGFIERVENLEQAERQSITNYYTTTGTDDNLPGLILQYYKTKDIQLLSKMDVEAVEECLKAAKKKQGKPATPKTNPVTVSSTSAGAQMVFDGNSDEIEDVVEQVAKKVDESPDKKSTRLNIETESGNAIQVRVEPVTQKVAEDMSDNTLYGGIIKADVSSPAEAISDIIKYPFDKFGENYLDEVFTYLERYNTLSKNGEESISKCLKEFLDLREKISPFRKRLQDVPMLQVLVKKELFSKYLAAYEKLLEAINEDFPKIWGVAPVIAKQIVNKIISLDYVYVLGEKGSHAIPTPLNPLYLWKYTRLSEEIICSKGVDVQDESFLTADDKQFIVRKSDDIPDPLSVMLIPEGVSENGSLLLPLTGRIGYLPVYSTQNQVNQSESGKDELVRSVIRYLCLYPHAGLLLKIAVIDPPSVEFIVSTLKTLNNDKEFSISGIEVSIYRTKKTPVDWVEIQDNSLNEGMLGSVKGRNNRLFKLNIKNVSSTYPDIIQDLQNKQHIIVVFDPNEIKIERVKNNNQIHIHPLCVPKIYHYDPIQDEVEIRPTNEGGIFSVYASILEKLNEHQSLYSHTSAFFNTPLKKETYDSLLEKGDWLIILDQSLKSWDLAFQTASEKLYYKESDYRSVGIYSKHSRKFILGYDSLVKSLGNFIPNSEGISNVIDSIRALNNDGLLSIVSHTSNRIFDTNHGKGSLGLAIAAMFFKLFHRNSLLVGLDTQLAQNWLANRDDDELPDMVGIEFKDDVAHINLIEVKTYGNNPKSYVIDGQNISGHAVDQVSVLENLVKEMFGKTERITTISRREILREQVFEALYQSHLSPNDKHDLSEKFNDLFAGDCSVEIEKSIFHVDFEEYESSRHEFQGIEDHEGEYYNLYRIGQDCIQKLLTNSNCGVCYTDCPLRDPFVKEWDVIPVRDEYGEIVSPETKPVGKEEEKPMASLENKAIESKSVALDGVETKRTVKEENDIAERCRVFNSIMRTFTLGVKEVTSENVLVTSKFYRFKIELKPGEQIKHIEKFKEEIALRMLAVGKIMVKRLEGTPYVAVDIPFDGGKPVALLDHLNVLDSTKGQLNIVSGQNANGEIEVLDVAEAPHLLVAGTTGSGKTVFLYSMIVSWLEQFSPEDIQLLIIDPKQTDFVYFDEVSDYLYGGRVITDCEEALEALTKINEEDKDARTQLLKLNKCRDISEYNSKHPENQLGRLVVIIDEYADLIQTAEMLGKRKQFEQMLTFLAQRVRSLGIHLVIATQRPTASVVTGTFKANIPYRISFKLPSVTDSMTILDRPGADDLLGKGDMLIVKNGADADRLQGLYISGDELESYIGRKNTMHVK